MPADSETIPKFGFCYICQRPCKICITIRHTAGREFFLCRDCYEELNDEAVVGHNLHYKDPKRYAEALMDEDNYVI